MKESALKAESPAVEPSKVQEEMAISADSPKVEAKPTGQLPPPKAKEEAVVQQPEIAVQETAKAKAEVMPQQQQLNVEGKAVEKVDPPKSGSQSPSLLTVAGIKGVFGFGPSKPERPPPVPQGDGKTQIEQDEEADFNAAVQASLQSPASPQPQSGAQSSTPRPADLDEKEFDLNTQLDKLSAEALRLETITNPSIRDKSRMRTIEGVTQSIVNQLEEIAQQRLSTTSTAAVVYQSKPVQPAKPIAAPPVLQPQPSSASVKAVSPHTQQPLTIEGLLRGAAGQQDTGTGRGGQVPLVSVEITPAQSANPTEDATEPTPVRSRERTPPRRSRSPTPAREVQLSFPAIEDGPPPRKEVETESPKERERTPRKERPREKKKKRRSPSTSRDRSISERRRSPTPTKDRSQRSERRSQSPRRDRPSMERRHSSASTRESRHHRRRRSPTPKRDRKSQERRRSPSSSRESPRDRRRRRHSPEPSEVSREERRRSPSPKVVPESSRVSSKKSKKSEKKEKKSSKSRRKTEAIEVVDDDSVRKERSRSERRLGSSKGQPLQSVSLEDTETDERPPKDDRPGTVHQRSARPRPRFDPSREHASAQRVIENRKVVQPQRVHGRDPGTDGPPEVDTEAKQRRRNPPPPPPSSTMRQPQTGHRALAFARPPPRRDSVTESSQVSERPQLRIRSQETPPQRPMPRRVVATSTMGSSAPPRLQNVVGSASRGEYHDQSRVRDDRMYGSQPQQETQQWGSSQRRVPSMGRRESLHTWAGHQHSGQQYQGWSHTPPTTQEYWHDPQQGQSQQYSQQAAATQQWHAQQQQQMQQQLPALPTPVYPPGMHPTVQPPPGLSSNVQRTRQGVMTQGASMQGGSAASRQQSPAGTQPPQDRHQSSYGQQYPSTGGYFRQGYQ